MKNSMVFLLVLLSGCSWFHAKKPKVPEPAELIVTGAPAGSLIYIDDVQAASTAAGTRPQIVDVKAGSHTLEIRTDAAVAYRESFDVDAAETRTITVLSGRPAR